jgi:hypothetical protein
MRVRKGEIMAKKTEKQSPKKASDWPPMHREIEATEEPDSPSEAIMHHNLRGSDLASELAALPGMNQTLAEKMVEDGNWSTDAGELAHKYGLMQLDAEGVLKVLNRNRGGK